MEAFLIFNTMSWPEALLRVFLAVLFGFFVGYDRNRKNKPIDFRVYMIVAATTCLLAMMGEELNFIHNQGQEDIELGLLRIVQGVLTGIGFLGAGAIMKSEYDELIVGTTTGASIWGAGAVGLMIGFGLYGLAFLGFSVLLVILVLFGFLKKPLFHQTDTYGDECDKNNMNDE
jgi:putative Mg2+ transporter-C (MgtC) family protein